MKKLTIPAPGFGTFKIPDDGTAEASVREALRAGYRHVDTAAVYGNEAGVGRGIAGFTRGDIFLTTKLWNTERGYDKVLRAFDQSLSRLGTDYVDLYLLHWPANRLQFGDKADALNADSWRALERLYKDGRAKAIGLSNFEERHIEALDWTAEIAPMADQVEFHPGFSRPELRAFCEKRGITMEAWSPLRSGNAMNDPQIATIAARHGKTPAQVILRWCIQLDVVPLVKSVHPERIRENLQVSDFFLSEADMALISALEGGRAHTDPEKAEF
ncbi:MAG: aldo/keto reductase [Bacteroidales bacterium]|nr:aldo/keto reductase [Bacteroidales bacterium]